MRRFTPERWQRLAPILDEAFELPPNARADYLDRTCVGDVELRSDAEALLAAELDSTGFLEEPLDVYMRDIGPDAVTPSALAAEATTIEDLDSGTLIGPYRVIGELARGGMGAVYVAERADGQFEQRVALKLARRGIDGIESHRRFL